VKTITASAAKKLGGFLTKDFRRIFGTTHDDLAERLGALGRTTIECLARSDALYHNYEHTFQVTLVGRDILQGMSLAHRIEPDDYAHLIVACLLHDIGYMRGVLSGDTADEFIIDESGKTIELPRGASDAALSPYHVDRSKIFARERLEKSPHIDVKRVMDAIECTRFPPMPMKDESELSQEPRLVQAADLIGQLGDPNYMRKANALFHEFNEIGLTKTLGYKTPADVVYKYPQFYWKNVAPQIPTAIRYLNVTSSGRQWVANLYSNVFRAERELTQSGPQM
jgi:hypothetical protein